MKLAEGDTRLLRGVRISSPARAWCELGPDLQTPDLVAAADFLLARRSPLTSLSELSDSLDDVRAGVRRLREALALADPRSESRRESLLRVILVTAGLTGIRANFPIRTSGGFSYRADLAFPEKKLILEYQSRLHEGEAFFRDMTRKSRLAADGWLVIEINAYDLRNPDELVARVRTALAGR
jgi:very-short-patch-repair endonuclease